MKEFNTFLYDKYVFYYYNLLVLNYAKEDKDKALSILRLAKKNDAIKKLPAYTSFIYLNTALIYYYQEKYNSAKTNISRLIQQQDFLSLDLVFQLKLLIVELIIRLKLKENDPLIKKINEIKFNYSKLIRDESLVRDYKVIASIEQLAQGKNLDKKALINYFDTTHEDDIIDYHIWSNDI